MPRLFRLLTLANSFLRHLFPPPPLMLVALTEVVLERGQINVARLPIVYENADLILLS